MDSKLYHLIKRDVEPNSGVEIATYRVESIHLEAGQKYVICKNEKRIGWAMDETGALQIHDMYARVHIFHEDNSDPDWEAKMEQMRSKSQDNTFLHEFKDTKI